MEQWIGISCDEIVRAKPRFEPWQVKRFPLIEKRMNRRDCLAWLRRHGYPDLPKSACVGCPFHDNARWRFMRDHDLAKWADAIEVGQALRNGIRDSRGEVFLHRSCLQLDEADLSTASDRGQLDLWPNECEGMCGVEDRERRRGGQSVPPPLRAAALRLLRLPFLPRRRVENSRNPGLRPSLCSFLRCSSSLQIPPCPLRGAAARSRSGRAGPTHLVPPHERKLHDQAAPTHRAEHDAIRAYAMEHGRYWKASLRDDWMNARTTGVMQALRNSHGPSWLVSFSLTREQSSAGPIRAISITAGNGDLFEATMIGVDEPWMIAYPEGQDRFHGTEREVRAHIRQLILYGANAKVAP